MGKSEKKIKSSKKEKKEIEVDVEGGKQDKKIYVSEIAVPLANPKLASKVLSFAKKHHGNSTVRRGVKEVVKAIRKGQKGLCIIAGNISPMDVISHIPVLCEDNNIPYLFVPSKEEMGASAGTKRATSVLLVQHAKRDQADSKDKEFDSEVSKLMGKLKEE